MINIQPYRELAQKSLLNVMIDTVEPLLVSLHGMTGKILSYISTNIHDV